MLIHDILLDDLFLIHLEKSLQIIGSLMFIQRVLEMLIEMVTIIFMI